VRTAPSAPGILLMVLLLPALAAAQSVGPLVLPPAPPATKEVSPPRLAETFGVPPLAVLPAAGRGAADRLKALQDWNDAGRVPPQAGLVRSLPRSQRVVLGAELLDRAPAAHAGGIVAPSGFDHLAWGAEVRVEGAYRLRLHLAGVRLPVGARLWVHGDDVAGPFGLELRAPDGGLWTPSIGGESARLDVELPAAAFAGGKRFSFTIDRVLELVPLAGEQTGPCNVDASCVGRDVMPAIDDVRRAVARLEFVSGASAFLCSGGLLNDSDPRTEVPYLLTAHHCFSTPDAAASLEAWFDDETSSCNGAAPALNGLPRANGATLLASGDSSDYTLVRLNAVPGGRVFLGWNADPGAVPDGTLVHRLSHPDGDPQSYTSTRVSTTVPACFGARPSFLYSTQVTGGTFGGSSGAPLVLGTGQVVGQLLGGCNSADDCSALQYTVDGAFAATYSAIRQFIDPLGSCGGPDALCLLGGRFKVEVAWQNQFDGSSGTGHPNASSDEAGFFYFTDPANFELIVKILDFGNVVKVFYGQLTDLHFTMTVTDTRSGMAKIYHNGPNDCGAIDQSAFPGGGAAVAAAAATAAATTTEAVCAPGSLCLLGGRVAVQVAWRNQFDGSSGQGSPASLSDQSGLFNFTDPANIELVTKALDFGDRILFFWGALSDLEYTITATDSTTGAVKTYHNPPGTFCGGIDEHAF
jgi:trypsin-like peptidase